MSAMTVAESRSRTRDTLWSQHTLVRGQLMSTLTTLLVGCAHLYTSAFDFPPPAVVSTCPTANSPSTRLCTNALVPPSGCSNVSRALPTSRGWSSYHTRAHGGHKDMPTNSPRCMMVTGSPLSIGLRQLVHGMLDLQRSPQNTQHAHKCIMHKVLWAARHCSQPRRKHIGVKLARAPAPAVLEILASKTRARRRRREKRILCSPFPSWSHKRRARHRHYVRQSGH